MAKNASPEELKRLIGALTHCFYSLREGGRDIGLVSSKGGGVWGVLNSLNRLGPQTVPRLAQARPVARQQMQLLVNELKEQGLVELISNPAHRRSKLVALTPKGVSHFNELNKILMDWCAKQAPGFSESDIQTTVNVLNRLHELSQKHSGG